jgi:hypothetical protein
MPTNLIEVYTSNLLEVYRYFSCLVDLDVSDHNQNPTGIELIVRGSLQYQVRVRCQEKK